jgi:hypothetical protein
MAEVIRRLFHWLALVYEELDAGGEKLRIEKN